MTAALARSWRGWLFPVAVLAAAELWFAFNPILSDTLAPPSKIARDGLAMLFDGSLLKATGQTLVSAAAGLLIGMVAGTAAGFAIGLIRTAERTAAWVVELLRPIPSVALIPLALLTFGYGYRMEYSVVSWATFWPFLILTHNALRQIDVRLIEVSRLMGFGPLKRIWKIMLPAAAPRLFTALRLSVGLALVVAVTVEIAANPQGLGLGLMRSQEELQPGRMLAYLIWLGVLGWAINYFLLLFETRLFAHRTPHGGSTAP
ncbi:MAG: ABC transporter permease [Xanthobacteraceae bacterium]|nr:ABC transporter permease [Xanthobacteraceae bacterium]MCW5679069.1 ABC transporter permease [Xanthobacteraceae bacterium]